MINEHGSGAITIKALQVRKPSLPPLMRSYLVC